MKRSFFTLAIFVSALSVMFTSCNKDVPDGPDQYGGSYELTMDGNKIAEGDTEEIGMLGNAASVSKGEDFGILLANVPVTVGGTTQLDDEDTGGLVTIMGKNLLLDDSSDEMYFSVSGTIKRVSASKITFEGTCTDFGSETTHTFSGSMESNAFKLI